MDKVLQAAGGGMSAPVEVGDTVWVNLSGKWFRGQVKQLRPNHNWTDDTWAEVRGDTPEPFVTTARASNLQIDGDRLAVEGER